MTDHNKNKTGRISDEQAAFRMERLWRMVELVLEGRKSLKAARDTDLDYEWIKDMRKERIQVAIEKEAGRPKDLLDVAELEKLL